MPLADLLALANSARSDTLPAFATSVRRFLMDGGVTPRDTTYPDFPDTTVLLPDSLHTGVVRLQKVLDTRDGRIRIIMPQGISYSIQLYSIFIHIYLRIFYYIRIYSHIPI